MLQDKLNMNNIFNDFGQKKKAFLQSPRAKLSTRTMLLTKPRDGKEKIEDKAVELNLKTEGADYDSDIRETTYHN